MKLDYGTAGYNALSYSRQSTLHSCARKYQIENAFGLKDRQDSVTFSFGHAVAAGVQSYFEHQNEKLAVIECAKFYTMPWSDMGTASEMRGKKNVYYGIHATRTFCKQINSALSGNLAKLKGWEIARLADGKPAIELQFRIELENDFVYEGHIDLVIYNPTTKEYAVLELKTTTFREPNPASYGKSSQALSYSIVIDKAVGHANTSYKVFYLIWSSSAQEFVVMEFTKQAKQRLDWINNLVRDCDIIQWYEQASQEDGIPYPTNGASCYNFFRQCEYYTVCEMEDESIRRIYGLKDGDNTSFDYTDNVDFVFTLEEIINSQLAKVESATGLEVTPAGVTNGTIDKL